jgi:hypothetical protein
MTTTERLKLPLLAVAQAQKEMTHNEALTLLDVAVQPVVQAIAPASIPSSPIAGQCWIVGTDPSGEWAGQASALAAWTAGGWRFIAPFEGMTIWSIADAQTARWSGSTWVIGQVTATKISIGGQQVVGPRRPAIVVPAGGSAIDIQARNAIVAMLETLASHGLIA